MPHKRKLPAPRLSVEKFTRPRAQVPRLRLAPQLGLRRQSCLLFFTVSFTHVSFSGTDLPPSSLTPKADKTDYPKGAMRIFDSARVQQEYRARLKRGEEMGEQGGASEPKKKKVKGDEAGLKMGESEKGKKKVSFTLPRRLVERDALADECCIYSATTKATFILLFS